MTDWLGKQTVYSYDATGQLVHGQYPNGVWTDYAYDAADRLTGVVNDKVSSTISSFTYALDGIGNRNQMTDLSGTQAYQYDPLNRLTQVTYPGPQTDTHTYDAVGNRQTKNATTYTYDDADRMLSAGGVAYGYDNNGNQTSRGSDTFGYDHENRLTEAVIAGVTSSSTYNGDGLRMSHTVNGTTNYTWDVNRRVPEILQDGTNTYVYGLGRISATDSNGNQTYFLSDGLDSTTNLADGSGNVQASYSYDVFGAVRSQTGAPTNQRLFTGQQQDNGTGDSGLYYLRARYYDPSTGRFTAKDPFPGWSAGPQTQNAYPYVTSNPVNLTDPAGLRIPGPRPAGGTDKEGGHFRPTPPTGVPISGPAPCSSGQSRSVCCHIGGSYENAEVQCGYLRMTPGGLLGVIGGVEEFIDEAASVTWRAVTSQCAVGIVAGAGLIVIVAGSAFTGAGLVEGGALVTTSLGAAVTSGSTIVAVSLDQNNGQYLSTFIQGTVANVSACY